MQLQYQDFYLPNGLHVLVHTDWEAPKAAFNLLYRVGARDEQPHHTGLAHLFEHLMFEGSRHIPSYDQPLQLAGGENNAFTNNDITNYYISLPVAQIETAFWLESDRMLGLDFNEESLAVQKSVVIEEFKQRYLNQPYGDAYLRLRPLAYTRHPYGWMTIGKSLAHVEQTTLADVQQFFFNFYAPNNATLVVAGPITPEHVRDLAERWFGPIPRRRVQRPGRPTEPRQAEARRTEMSGPVPATQVFKSYHVPARMATDYVPTDLLTDVLSGQSGRLYQALVKDQPLCSQIGAFMWGQYDPGTLSINARINPGVAVGRYEEALERVLDDTLRTLSAAELQRQQNKVETALAFEYTQTLNRAMALAIYDSLGDAAYVNRVLDQYRAVTVGQVQAAQREYLRPDNCTTLVYRPAADSLGAESA
jgi:predicted Zn-dependent peptidase